jgi:hypothetical protein
MDFFKALIAKGIAPSEIWMLDIPSSKIILSEEMQEPMDLTVMLNAERMQNGAKREFLNGN